jgi:hypothetical protein
MGLKFPFRRSLYDSGFGRARRRVPRWPQPAKSPLNIAVD